MSFLIKGDLYGFKSTNCCYRRNIFVYWFCHLDGVLFSSKRGDGQAGRNGVIFWDVAGMNACNFSILTICCRTLLSPKFSVTIKMLVNNRNIWKAVITMMRKIYVAAWIIVALAVLVSIFTSTFNAVTLFVCSLVVLALVYSPGLWTVMFHSKSKNRIVK